MASKDLVVHVLNLKRALLQERLDAFGGEVLAALSHGEDVFLFQFFR